MVETPLLSMQGVSKRFGATQALRDVSLSVAPGEIMALIGENGAGKSTLMKILSGALAPDAGEVQLAGRPYAPADPLAARQAGVAMIYQELSLCRDLSVEDNIMLGQEQSELGFLLRDVQRPRVQQALAQLGHPELRPEVRVGELSVGAQQLVEIARALVFDAQVVIFDEPTSSLTRRDVERLFGVIRSLRHQGKAVIYISHFLEEIRQLCDRFTVLRDGATVGVGQVAGQAEQFIVRLMVGRAVEDLFPRVAHVPGEVLLQIDRLWGRRLPKDASLSVRRGEIVGLFGLVGAGRTELLRALLALDPVRSGSVQVGLVQPHQNPRARIAAGLGLVSEDRKGEGLAQSRSVADNLTLSRLSHYADAGLLNLAARRRSVLEWMSKLNIKAASPEIPVQSLSGGNQQKVALARIMHQDADVFLLDEPTRGIDVGSKAEIYRLMGELAARGKAVLFVSSYLPELMQVSDRLAVMSRGVLSACRPIAHWNEESIMAAAIAVQTSEP